MKKIRIMMNITIDEDKCPLSIVDSIKIRKAKSIEKELRKYLKKEEPHFEEFFSVAELLDEDPFLTEEEAERLNQDRKKRFREQDPLSYTEWCIL